MIKNLWLVLSKRERRYPKQSIPPGMVPVMARQSQFL
jgi:hypothetical protein